MSLVRQSIRAGLTLALPRRRFVTRGPVSSGGVCLTFDDGPHPEHTPRLLDVLGEQGVKGTFFVVGEEAEKHPELVKRIVAEGHAVGGHSWTHSEPRTTTTRQLLDEVTRTQELLWEVVGVGSTLFRPPKGELTAAKLLGLMRAGLTVVLWNVDPRDYARTSVEGLAAWFAKQPMRSGDIVLMHDAWPWAAGVIGGLARAAREGGLRFVDPVGWREEEEEKQGREKIKEKSELGREGATAR